MKELTQLQKSKLALLQNQLNRNERNIADQIVANIPIPRNLIILNRLLLRKIDSTAKGK